MTDRLQRHLGTQQGGPLSPLLANALLDEVDRALEARGHSFARYADECNVYMGSIQAGERVMAFLRKLHTGLKLQLNEAKSAVGSDFGRKFLGCALWVAKGREVKCAVTTKALGATEDAAQQAAGNCHRWWRNSCEAINSVLTIAYFDTAGCAMTAMTSNSRTPRCGPACRVVWQGCLR